MQGIISLLSFGSSDRGWAVICLSSAAMSKANGEHMLKSLREFNDWKNRSSEARFTPVGGESTRRMTGAAGEMGQYIEEVSLRAEKPVGPNIGLFQMHIKSCKLTCV
ncbi:hypothetical protein ACFX2I_011487 [Malus domestica]